MYFIGLDPGSKGGIVIVDYDSKPVLVMDLDKLTDHDVVTELKYFVNSLNTSTAVESQVFAALEDTVYMSAEKKGAVKYGENCGFLRGVLTTLDIPFERVSPQKWKKALGGWLCKHYSTSIASSPTPFTCSKVIQLHCFLSTGVSYLNIQMQ